MPGDQHNQSAAHAHSPRQVAVRWFVGLLAATLIVWFTGPWWLNSILLRQHDRDLAQVMLEPGQQIHWRSEGWGNTCVGPHGLPGWEPRPSLPKIVLWGDSQLEGFCVNDADKIHTQLRRELTQGPIAIDCDVIPLGRSGTSTVDWSLAMPAADALWQPRMHVWLVTEWSDLQAIADLATVDPTSLVATHAETPPALRQLAAWHGEAFFHAAKRLWIDPNSGQRRTLRWSVGPRVASPATDTTVSVSEENAAAPLLEQLLLIQRRSSVPWTLAYIPSVPFIGKKVHYETAEQSDVERLKPLVHQAGIDLLDVSQDLIAAYHQTGRLPHGFHNGYPGYGHLNALGNRTVAQALARHLKARYGSALMQGKMDSTSPAAKPAREPSDN